MSNATPYELIHGPVEVYIAPVGESFPAIGTEPPGGNWTLLGTEGSKEYSSDGVTVSHPQTIETFRGLGSTGPIKAFRTEEDLIVGFMVHDLTLEEYARALNFGTVTTDTDDKTIETWRGMEVLYRALLVRGIDRGPYGSDYNIQLQVPKCFQNSSPEVVFVKGEPAGLQLEFMTLVDLNASSDGESFGIWRTQFQN